MQIDIATLLGTTAISATAAVAVFQFLGKKWLENQFSKKLEDHKAKINMLFSRVSKIHEKEFEVLPEAWRLLQLAYGKVGELASSLKSYPDLDHMKPEELDEFLQKSRLNESDKKELVSAQNKIMQYRKLIFRYDLANARSAVTEFHNYTILNKIFMTKDLFEAFKAVDGLFSDVLLDQEIGTEANDLKMIHKYYRETSKKIEPLVESVEVLIQERLHHAEA